MELIFSAALCSVLVSILLKVCKSKGFDVLQMIGWNYAVASILCFFWFKPDFSQFVVAEIPWWLIVILGVALPGIFFLLSKSLETAGIVKTEIAQRLSVVLSLCAAYFIFGEQFNAMKLIGIGLGLTAIVLLLTGRGHDVKSNVKHGGWFLLSVWIGYAVVDVLLKYSTSLGLKFTQSLNLIFIFAFILTMAWLLVRQHAWHWQNLFAGISLGVLNFANIALYVKAHLVLKDSPAVVFAGMNILVVVFGVMTGALIFKEKLNRNLIVGLALAISGVFCLAQALR